MFLFFSRLFPLVTHRLCTQVIVPKREMSVVQKLARIQPTRSLIDQKKFKVVYSYQNIRIPAGFLRLKYSFPVFFLLFSPGALYFGEIQTVALGYGVICILQLGLIALMTRYLKRIVGKVYVNKTGSIEDVIISGLNKSGRRQDHKHSLSQLIVLDSSTKFEEKFGLITLAVKDSDTKFKLSIGNCIVHDEQACKTIFGEKNTQIMKLSSRKKK